MREITRGFTFQSNFRAGVRGSGDPGSRRGWREGQLRVGRRAVGMWVFGGPARVGAGVGEGRAGSAAAGAWALGLRAASAGRGEGGVAGRAAGGSRAWSGRAGPRGARRRARGAEGVGWVGVRAFLGSYRLGARSPSRGAGLGRGRVGAGDAAEVWESERDRVPGELKCADEEPDPLEEAGVSASRSGPNSAAAAGELFVRLAAPERWEGRAWRGGGRGRAEGSCGSRRGRPWRAAAAGRGSGPKRVLWEGRSVQVGRSRLVTVVGRYRC